MMMMMTMMTTIQQDDNHKLYIIDLFISCVYMLS